MAFYPGPGLGGHCIPIDPFYLTYKAREYNYHTRLIELAGEINNAMPEYVVDRAMRILNESGKALRGSKITVLGVAYKKDIDDMRESPVLPILTQLKESGADVTVVDPFVPSFRLKGETIETYNLTPELLQGSDIVLITTDHSNFDYEMIAQNSDVLFDTRNAMKNVQNKPARYVKL
jgi:UDP-N-acetyl-D-glucosamine dehydrogenase